MIDDAVVPVLAAEADVAFDRHRLKMPARQTDECRVEGPPAEVVNDNDGGRGQNVLALERVRQCRRARLVEDVDDIQTGDAAGVVRRLTARVVEIRWDRDDRLAYRPKVAFRVLDEL